MGSSGSDDDGVAPVTGIAKETDAVSYASGVMAHRRVARLWCGPGRGLGDATLVRKQPGRQDGAHKAVPPHRSTFAYCPARGERLPCGFTRGVCNGCRA